MKTKAMSLVLTFLALTTTAHFSFADGLNQSPRDSRIGGIVTNKDTGEELFLSCVEQNANAQCIQYRFIAQLGSQTRVLGNQEVEPFQLVNSDLDHAKKKKFFRGKKALPTLSWMADGFKYCYSDDEGEECFDKTNATFSSIYPVFGLPGIGGVVLVGSAAYDVARMVVLLPIEVIAKILPNSKSKLNSPLFKMLKADSRNSESLTISSERFNQLKATVVSISTAPVKP